MEEHQEAGKESKVEKGCKPPPNLPLTPWYPVLPSQGVVVM